MSDDFKKGKVTLNKEGEQKQSKEGFLIDPQTSIRDVLVFLLKNFTPQNLDEMHPIRENFKEVLLSLCIGSGANKKISISRDKDQSKLQDIGNQLSQEQGAKFTDEMFEIIVPHFINFLVQGDEKSQVVKQSFISKMLFRLVFLNKDRDEIIDILANQNALNWVDDDKKEIKRGVKVTL